MSKNIDFIVITRPDGTELYMNVDQIVYVTKDPTGESETKTELVTSQGAFIINKPVQQVLELIQTKRGK